jgi:hypothetical protein
LRATAEQTRLGWLATEALKREFIDMMNLAGRPEVAVLEYSIDFLTEDRSNQTQTMDKMVSYSTDFIFAVILYPLLRAVSLVRYLCFCFPAYSKYLGIDQRPNLVIFRDQFRALS